jgi:Protein of unknown function (DUF2656)
MTSYKSIGTDTRMLLSHNFDITDPAIPVLTKGNFTEIYVEELDLKGWGYCQRLDSPHWVMEIQFDSKRITPQQMGDRIVQELRNARSKRVTDPNVVLPHVLALGGLKSTPAEKESRNSLQINEWGVDVIETVNADAFLAGLNWEATIATRDPATIFQSILK